MWGIKRYEKLLNESISPFMIKKRIGKEDVRGERWSIRKQIKIIKKTVEMVIKRPSELHKV